jgi:hypothetical protein
MINYYGANVSASGNAGNGKITDVVVKIRGKRQKGI